MASRLTLSTFALITTFACNAALAKVDSVDSAFRLCAFFDNSGLTSEKCKVSGWDESVNVTMDMTSETARTSCKMLAASAKKNKILFTKGWTLKIYSPYSGEKTIAFCPLG